MEVFARSDIGQKRVCNEDSYGYTMPNQSDCAFFVVADGMGGAKAGEIASRMAVTTLIHYFEEHLIQQQDITVVCEGLRQAVSQANAQILEASQTQEACRGMGTTVVCACVVGHRLVVVNVGDSRAYLVTGRSGTQLTEDHSLVEHLVRTGQIDRAEAKIHPRRNEITRALGAGAVLQADLFLYDYRPGDVLLLCSDGLTRTMEDKEIFSIAGGRGKTPEWICNKLIALANAGGGPDNITVMTAIL